MAQPEKRTPEIEDARVYLSGVAKYLVEKFYGSTGPAWGTSLRQLEDLLFAVQQQLAADFFALALDLQARQLHQAPPDFHACPSCRCPLEATDIQSHCTQTTVGLAEWNEPQAYCLKCRRDFFPQSRALGIDQSEISPAVLGKVISFGTRCRSFTEAHDSLKDGTGLEVSPKQIENFVHQVGHEVVQEREALVEHFQQLPLADKFAVPEGVTAPELAVVMVDGGRLQLRTHFNRPRLPAAESAAEQEPAPSPAEAGSEEDEEEADPSKKHWREDKVGLLMSMDSEPSADDPCPEIPPAFLEFQRVSKLARQIRQQARQGEEAAGATDEPEAETEALAEHSRYEPPKVEQKRVVASRLRWPRFALIVAATAWLLGYQGARRKAFVGDGSDNNWSIHRRFFGSFVAILDFIHALSYVFAAALAGRTREAGQAVYRRWIRWLWKGDVRKVIKELARRVKELGKPEAGDGETQPRVVVATALRYLLKHRGKMSYAEYRKEGLPITSSLMESTVKQINHRVKGSEKFWTEEGAEAILQLRADQLSEGGLEDFWERREANATGQRRYRSTNRPSRKPKSSKAPFFPGVAKKR